MEKFYDVIYFIRIIVFRSWVEDEQVIVENEKENLRRQEEKRSGVVDIKVIGGFKKKEVFSFVNCG